MYLLVRYLYVLGLTFIRGFPATILRGSRVWLSSPQTTHFWRVGGYGGGRELDN